MDAVQCVWDAGATLGEGPVWSVREQALYWVDILSRRLHRYAPGQEQPQRSWQFDEEISAVAERTDNAGLVVTLRHGLAFFDPSTEKLQRLTPVETGMPGNRFNDGKIDARGRFWAGTMDFGCKEATGSLYRVNPDLKTAKMDEGYAITNGPAWSIDYRVMYHNDTFNGRVYAFDFDLESGEISNKRLFLQFTNEDGNPDGMTTDAEGGLWIAHWGPGLITRHDAQGTVTRTVTLPAKQITSCAFGGPDFRTLYVTSAADGLSREEREKQQAGGLFALQMDIAGMPANLFRG